MALEVSARRRIPANPGAVWRDIVQADRFAEWYAFCDTVDVPEPGIRVLIGSWGAQRSTVTTRTTVEDPPHRYAWEHLSETLDGQRAPGLAMESVVEIVLEPVEGMTEVTITSTQRVARWWQAWAMRLLGRRKVANMLEQSLTLLEARHR